ncbi:MAG: hypothetical protein KME27_04370 [Lyngbya sp. HA4199-MV5]|nr:hypothetical protein [Lyngbya sp. HA4199-MV5]
MVQTILFIELLGGIGDVLMALPAMQALGRAYPQAKLTVLTFAPGSELIQHDPLIHKVIGINHGQIHTPDAVHKAVAALLKRDRFDLIASDTNYGGIEALIQQSQTPCIVTNLWRSPPPNQKVSDRFLHILQAEEVISPNDIAPVQLHVTSAEREAARQTLGAITQPLVILYPDAGMAIKRWSTANFVQVGKALQQRYNATIVVPIGSNREQSTHIASTIGGTATVWQQGTLRELAGLLAHAALVIASDTGPARIAAALQTPTITLFGPSWHDRYGQPAPHVNLQGYPDCPERDISNFTTQRCWYSGDCPFDRWQTCLDDISLTQVLAVAGSFLRPSDSNRPLAPSKLKPPTLEPNHSTSELGAPSLNLKQSSSELGMSSLELHHSTSELGMSSLELHHSTSELGTSSLELHHSTSELGTSSLELHHSTSELERSSLKLKPSTLELQHSGSELDPWSSLRNLLVMRLDNIGDVLMTSPALRAIKEALPNTRLTLMASPGGLQAAALLPWVDEVITCRALWQDLGKLAFDPDREASFIQTLRDRQFDAAIIFTSFSQTPHPAGLMCYLAGIPLRLGQSKEWGGSVLTTEVKSGLDTLHQVERNLRLVEAVGFPVSDRSLGIHIPISSQHSVTAKLLEHGLNPHEPYILLNPWTSCQSRNYPRERFAIAAQTLAQKTGYRIAVTGVAADRAHSAPLLERLGSAAIDLIGQTSLAELAALIDQASLMVSNNTSTMHLADATRTPSVILFSGTEYECQWQPRHTTARLLRQPTDCSPCYAFTCPFNLECLDIAPEQVVEASLALLQTAVPVQSP